jgi:hypothetical protein
MPLTNEQRETIVAEAYSWVRAKTPYRGWSAVKGMGADCGQLIYGIFRETKHLPIGVELPKDYSLQVAQHQASTAFVDVVASYMREIPEHEAQAADVVVYELGLAYAHAGIIVSWPDCIIHAIAHRGVTEAHGKNTPLFRRCRKKFFTLQDQFTEGR